MSDCWRCGKPLSQPISLERHYGPICWGKVRTDDTREVPALDQTTVRPLAADLDCVECRRHPDPDRFQEITTNVPRTIVHHSPCGFEWGYHGSGPADFALNILAHFTNPMFARRWHQEFKRDFVAGLPFEGGIIPGALIRAWIRERKGERAPGVETADQARLELAEVR